MKNLEKKFKNKGQYRYRLGIDMGSTSLGWCMVELDKQNEPCGIIDIGIRIIPDGRDDKSKEPLSVSRRTFRGMRRNLDRNLDRRKNILNFFDRHGFLPQDKAERSKVFLKDPISLRKDALDKQLILAEIARALIHLAKRRGFKSNRKSAKEEKATEFKAAMQNLEEQLKNHHARSLGEYLWMRNNELPKHKQHQSRPIKFRYDKNLEDDERIFPTRAMVENEFDLIWNTQAGYNPKLTDELKAELKNIIFYQRELKPQEVGKCTFEEREKRCPRANPLFQEFRLRQDINHLKLINTWDKTERDLTPEERDKLYNLLNLKKEVTFKAMRKELLGKGVADEYRFNSETENKDKMQGNLTNYVFNKQKELGLWWNAQDMAKQTKIIDILLDDSIKDETALLLFRDEGLSPDMAKQMLNVMLPDDYGSLSVKALNKILPHLRKGEIFSTACQSAGYKHSGHYNGEIFDAGKLPYYGELLKKATLPLNRKAPSYDKDADEHGKINNPTVHIALNQLRKLVNALSLRYGIPYDISLELARESSPPQKLLNSMKEQLGISVFANKDVPAYIQYQNLTKRIQEKNTKNNERIDNELALLNTTVNAENRLRFKLWEELSSNALERQCVYCGKQISSAEVFASQIEIEHILPKSRTYDDNVSNKTLSHKSCNNFKGEKSPFEAFSSSPGSFDWKAICERAEKLPPHKRWRFQEKAMEQFGDENKVLDRMLNDTRYMSRVAAEYMQYVCGKQVVPVTGKLTEVLRRHWGLNTLLGEKDSKERTDHRHHAIDAFVIAMTDRAMVKRFADAMKQGKEDFKGLLAQPYNGFNHKLMQDKVNSIMVSYKPEQVNPALLRKRRQTAGGLMKETAYGYIGPDPENSKLALFSARCEVPSLKFKDIEFVRDDVIKKALTALQQISTDEKDFKQKLQEWSKQQNIKKVKVIEKANPNTMIPVKDKNGRVYKYYASDENLYADIFNPRPFDPKSKWQMEIVKSFDAHQKEFEPNWKKQYPMGKLIMRLYKNDVVAFTNAEGVRELRRVRKMTPGIIYLRELNITTKPKGKEDIGEQFSANQLQIKRASKAGIDIIGRYFDPVGVKDAGDRA